jgi:uncharacterized membrane protein YgdD (TMEM256/DUF423 family)
MRWILLSGALLGGLGVALGAFGAHGLRNSLDATRLGWWNTGVQYQLWHAVALLALAALPLPRRGLAAVLMTLGTILFAGTLYVMALTGLRWLGAVTPLGGLLMIGGWATLAWAAFRAPQA